MPSLPFTSARSVDVTASGHTFRSAADVAYYMAPHRSAHPLILTCSHFQILNVAHARDCMQALADAQDKLALDQEQLKREKEVMHGQELAHIMISRSLSYACDVTDVLEIEC